MAWIFQITVQKQNEKEVKQELREKKKSLSDDLTRLVIGDFIVFKRVGSTIWEKTSIPFVIVVDSSNFV